MTVIENDRMAEDEWGVWYRHPLGQHITWVRDEAEARADASKKPAPEQVIKLVRRKVVYEPFEVMAAEAWQGPKGSRA